MKVHLLILSMILVSGCCRSQLNSPCSKQKLIEPNTEVLPKKPMLEVSGGAHLEGLHPSLIKKARVLYETAYQEGIQIKFISGYRRFRKRKSTDPKKSVASWHNFGAAFDLNLRSRKNMKDSLSHLSEDQKSWDRIGEVAESLGLTWGRQWGEAEIFHFEWHPGHPDAIREPAFKKLIKVTGDKVNDYQKAWSLFADKEGGDS